MGELCTTAAVKMAMGEIVRDLLNDKVEFLVSEV
jgi:hypothetical protein